MKVSIYFAIALLVVASGCASKQAQQAENSPEKTTQIKTLVDSKNYVFIANSVSPQRGRVRQLSYGYDMTVSPDTIKASLPYFGRAYSAPIGSSEGGINFTSTNFEYTAVDRPKGGWDITIKPKESIDARQLQLYISGNGYASLNVVSNNRDPISFSGTIAERKRK